jgi:hypothetical protein
MAVAAAWGVIGYGDWGGSARALTDRNPTAATTAKSINELLIEVTIALELIAHTSSTAASYT